MKYYYSGILLPKIPDDVIRDYPYCWIRRNTTTGFYDLVVSASEWYFGDGEMRKSVKAFEPYYRIPMDSYKEYEEWPHYKTLSSTFGIDENRPVMWSNRDIPNGAVDAVEIYFYGSDPAPEYVPKYLIRSGPTLYTVADGALSALNETEVTTEVFQTYGVDYVPDGALLVGLTDPEVMCWNGSADELPDITITVKGTPPLPQIFTTEPMDLTHESIAGISHAAVDASADVRFAISFDDGASWKAFDGSAWFDVSDTAPGMLASTMNAITAEQWAEVVQLTDYRLRFWLPNVTAYVKSVVMHYINP